MTESLLLDTHIVLWLDTGDSRLKSATRDAIDGLWRAGGSVLLSSVSAWEIALLADSGRISLDRPPEAWVERFVNRAGVEAAPLTWRAGARAYLLPNFERRDPADRLLVGTTSMAKRCLKLLLELDSADNIGAVDLFAEAGLIHPGTGHPKSGKMM